LGVGLLFLLSACSDTNPVNTTGSAGADTPNGTDTGQLYGYVYDAESNNPIGGALIQVYKGASLIGSGYSNNDGSYDVYTMAVVPGWCTCVCLANGHIGMAVYLNLPTSYDWYLVPE
jgi:hypothetical protein